MGLFQKQPVNNNLPLYTLGVEKTYLIIGLGNPGKEYSGTRHNIGFDVVDEFALKNNFPAWSSKKDLKCGLTISNLGGNRVILCRPATFMNNSGEAAQAVQRFYKVYNDSTLAVYDELAIRFGQIRTRVGGSDAGHNGVKSLTTHIGEDFRRLRVGIGNDFAPKADASDFVLGRFTEQEQGALKDLRNEACAMITEFIFSGALAHDTRTII